MWVDVSSDWRPVRNEKKKKNSVDRPNVTKTRNVWNASRNESAKWRKTKNSKKKKKGRTCHRLCALTSPRHTVAIKVGCVCTPVRVLYASIGQHALNTPSCVGSCLQGKGLVFFSSVCVVDVVDVDVTVVSTAYHRGRVSVHYSFEYSQALLWNAQLIMCRMISIISSGCCCCCQLLFFPPWPFSLLLLLFPFAAFFSVPFSYD